MVARILAALALVCAIAAPASATVYTVCAAGSPTCDADCAGAPALLLTLSSSDELEFQAGVTCSAIALVYPSVPSGIVVKGVPGSPATLSGSGTTANAIKVSNSAVVKDLVIRDYTGVAVTTVAGTKVYTLQDLTIDATVGCATGPAAGSVWQRIKCTPTSGIGLNAGTAAITIKNCDISGSNDKAIFATTSTCTHNTIANLTGGLYALQCGSASFNVVVNNTSSSAAIYTGGTTSYNVAYGNSPKDCSTTCGTGTISADPLLVSPTDHHLQSGSPAINMPVGSTETVDLEGNARDGSPDAGAYEYISTGPAPGSRYLRVSTSGARVLRVGTDGTRTKRVQ